MKTFSYYRFTWVFYKSISDCSIRELSDYSIRVYRSLKQAYVHFVNPSPRDESMLYKLLCCALYAVIYKCCDKFLLETQNPKFPGGFLKPLEMPLYPIVI